MSNPGPYDPRSPWAPAPGSGPPPPPSPSYGNPPPGFGGFGGPQPGPYFGAGRPSPSTGLAVGALVCGVVSLLAGLVPILNWFSWPLALVAIGLGIAGISKAKSQGGAGRGMAIAGLITGILAILVTIVWTVVLLVVASDADNDINSDPSDGTCNEERFLQDPDC